MTSPASDDVIVRQGQVESETVFMIGTASSPTQFFMRTLDSALARARAYAERKRVCAWLAEDGGPTLIASFRSADHPDVAQS
jgi:hypothetical protein